MKNRNCVYSVLLLILLTLPGCDATKSESKTPRSEYNGKSMLSLILTLDKTLYTSNEEIGADVLLKNIGTNHITVNARMALMLLPSLEDKSELAGDLLFVIVSPSGNRATTNGNWRIRRIVESDFIVLSPRRGILGSYNLQSYFTFDEFGTYSVYVIYRNQFDSQKDFSAWTGELASNTVYFEIAP
jgi:hypothetical protein